MTTIHGPINTEPWQEERTVNLSIVDTMDDPGLGTGGFSSLSTDTRRWMTRGTGTTKRNLGAPLRRTPVRSTWPDLGPSGPSDPVRRVGPSRATRSTLDALRKHEPLLWGRAGNSISFRSDRLRDEADYRRSQRGKRIVKVEREHTRYGSHPTSLDRIFPGIEWTEPEPRTSPLLTNTRETARRVRAQFGHLGGKSKLNSARNVDHKETGAFIAARRAR